MLLLCCFAAAPAQARTSTHHPRTHLVKVVGVAVGDLHASTLGLDQPGLTPDQTGAAPCPAHTASTTNSSTPAVDTTVHSTRTRGPPTSVR